MISLDETITEKERDRTDVQTDVYLLKCSNSS